MYALYVSTILSPEDKEHDDTIKEKCVPAVAIEINVFFVQ